MPRTSPGHSVVALGTPQAGCLSELPWQPPCRSVATSAPLLRAVDWPSAPLALPHGTGRLGAPTKSHGSDSCSFLVHIVVSAYLCLCPVTTILGTAGEESQETHGELGWWEGASHRDPRTSVLANSTVELEPGGRPGWNLDAATCWANLGRSLNPSASQFIHLKC